MRVFPFVMSSSLLIAVFGITSKNGEQHIKSEI
jgi:hypothetical protein